MYVRDGARVWKVIWSDKWQILLLLVFAVGTELIEPFLPQVELFSIVYVGVLSAALSIFLVFRFNEAYERWWEARKLWGQLVNLSRIFGRQVTTFRGVGSAEDREQLVYGQIAFANALRIRLRQKDADAGRAAVEPWLRQYMHDDADKIARAQNVPNVILQFQGAHIERLLQDDTAGAVMRARFDDTLSGLADVQGSTERIKSTAFPDSVTLITRMLVWGLVLLLFLATVGPDGRGGIIATLAVVVMALGYIWIDSMARDLKDPFESRDDDTPMSALCTTIERDLREMLYESKLPPVAQPKKGVLM